MLGSPLTSWEPNRVTGPEKLLPPFRPFYGLLASAEETASARTGVKVRISEKKSRKFSLGRSLATLCKGMDVSHGIFF